MTLNRSKMTAGHEALTALKSGSLLKKKWMGSVDTREAPAMTKTERLIRCRMQDGKVVVHYHHKVLYSVTVLPKDRHLHSSAGFAMSYVVCCAEIFSRCANASGVKCASHF